MRIAQTLFALRDMSDADVRAVYRYTRSLGAKGIPAPAYVPPGGKAATPYMEFMPRESADQGGREVAGRYSRRTC